MPADGERGAWESPLSRSRRVDWLLLATLLPVYLVLQLAGVHAHLASGERALPFRLSGAAGSEGYPVVLSLRAPLRELQQGDAVHRIGGVELRGSTRAELEYRTRAELRAGSPLSLEVGRAGARFETQVDPLANPTWWWGLPTWLALVAVGTFLLLRAPYWHLARVFFVACVGFASYFASLGPTHPVYNFASLVLALPGAMGLTPYMFLAWRESSRPRPALVALCVVVGLTQAGTNVLRWHGTPNDPEAAGLSGNLVLWMALSIAALVAAYRRSTPLERRQLRWIVYANVIGIVPVTLASTLRDIWPVMSDIALSLTFAMAAVIPLGYAIAIVGYGWLDIDRVISASAAASVLGAVLLGGLLAIVPPAAGLASSTLGVDPETGRLALSMALAGALVPAYRRIHPWLDRRLFAERHALAARFETLRAELGTARGVEEMATRAGEGFDALLHPESVAIYGRAGEAFMPLFLRGKALPPAFETASMLVQVLEKRGQPLFARAKELGPFERAALETLGAEVVVPQLREGRLVAFTCLGGKRSGDIYTASDLALLASVAQRCGEVIERIDLETLAKESQAMQSALRRYVPGAVAERVLAGDALAPAEREVTVLFVDIRGYTGLAERLAAEDVFATLNEHTERVSRIVQENGGTIVEFNGDGMMAVFGAPEALAKKEQSAVEAARKIVDSMPGQLAVGVGVATGSAFVGSIRSTDRLIWSAVGSTTNLAARLQAMTREFGASIALDETTRERAGYVCTDFARHENLAIRGRTGRFDVFALALPERRNDGATKRTAAP
jgi:class 3 adenylate cyclase